jgi:ribosomal protein L37AE/L43A
MQNLLNHENGNIPFNFKNVLHMDHNLNMQLNKNSQTAAFYKCRACNNPFSVGNCGKVVQESNCNNCGKKVGGLNYQMNPNTEKITYDQYAQLVRIGNNYELHEYIKDPSKTLRNLTVSGFRTGHLFTHALYAGLSLLGIVDCGEILLEDTQNKYMHLHLEKAKRFDYFYLHVLEDLNWMREHLKINELPVNFINYVVQDIAVEPRRLTDDEELDQVQINFGNFADDYFRRFEEISREMERNLESEKEKEIVNERVIKRKVKVDELGNEIDRFLFLNLRQTVDLNLALFKSQLGQCRGKYPKLENYLRYIVRINF